MTDTLNATQVIQRDQMTYKRGTNEPVTAHLVDHPENGLPSAREQIEEDNWHGISES